MDLKDNQGTYIQQDFFFGGSQAGKGEYAVPYLISGSRQHTTCIAQKDKSFVKAMADISDKT